MSPDQPRHRRPASLTTAQADQIPGGVSPEVRSEVAHDTARALLAGTRSRAREGQAAEVVRRLVDLVRTEGLEDLATLWSSSPARSMPGTLWRLYRLHTWVHADPSGLARTYEAGIHTSEYLELVAGVPSPPGPDELRDTLDRILSGAFTGDLAVALDRAAAVCRILAFGSGHEAGDDVDPELVRDLTRRAGGLLRTADELSLAAALERDGHLD